MEVHHREGETESCTTYDLGDCIFHPSHGELRSKGTDNYLHIEKKVAQVFECLAKAKGEIVTREEIFDHVWPNLIVSDDSLNRCISVLRKKLKSFDHQLAIKTHPKIGFNIESPCFKCHGLNAKPPAYNSSTYVKKNHWHKHYWQLAIIASLVVFVASALLINIYSFVFSAPANETQQLIVSTSKIIIMPFKLDAKVLKNNPLLEMEFRQLIANHPIHDSIAIDELTQTNLLSPRLIGQHFNAQYVFEAQGYYLDGREILNWQLVDAQTGIELLNKKLNLALNSTEINSRQLATEFIDTYANIHYKDNKAQHIQYIVDSAQYLFTPQSNQRFQRPVITLLASKIAQVDPESIIALRLLAELLTKTILSNSKTNLPYINLAISTLENLMKISPAQADIFQSLSTLYLLKYRWHDAREILELGDIALKNQGEKVTLARAMLHEFTGHNSKASIEKRLSDYSLQPFNQEMAINLITALLENQQYQQVLEIADNFEINSSIWRTVGHFIGPLYIIAGNQQRGEQITTQGYLMKGLEQQYIDLFIAALNQPSKQSEVIVVFSQAAKQQKIPQAVLLSLYANLMADEHYFNLAFSLAEKFQFNVLSTTLHSNNTLRQDQRFLVLMEKILLTTYWKTYGYPEFCQNIPDIRCGDTLALTY